MTEKGRNPAFPTSGMNFLKNIVEEARFRERSHLPFVKVFRVFEVRPFGLTMSPIVNRRFLSTEASLQCEFK